MLLLIELEEPTQQGFRCGMQREHSVGVTRAVLPLSFSLFRKFLSGWGGSCVGKVPNLHKALG